MRWGIRKTQMKKEKRKEHHAVPMGWDQKEGKKGPKNQTKLGVGKKSFKGETEEGNKTGRGVWGT